MKPPLVAAFPFVWIVVAVGSMLYRQSLTAAEKRRLNSQVTLLSLGVMFCYVLLVTLVEGVWLPGAVLVGFGVVVGYLSIAKSRLCEACNRNIQPRNLVTPVEFCSRCGAATVPYDPPFA